MTMRSVAFRRDTGEITGASYSAIAPTAALDVLEVNDGVEVDPSKSRVDTVLRLVRPITVDEKAAQDAAAATATVQRLSRQVDVVTTVAFVIARVNPAAWNAMTPAQKRTAVQTGCDQWRDLRAVVDTLL